MSHPIDLPLAGETKGAWQLGRGAADRAYNLRWGEKFSVWIRRNPLKSPESNEPNKTKLFCLGAIIYTHTLPPRFLRTKVNGGSAWGPPVTAPHGFCV
jgi:hypothetical protein